MSSKQFVNSVDVGNELMEIFGISGATLVNIRFAVDEMVTITIERRMTEEEKNQFFELLKKHELENHGDKTMDKLDMSKVYITDKYHLKKKNAAGTQQA